LYINDWTGEATYSLAEASYYLGITPAQLMELIRAKKIGFQSTAKGLVLTNADIATYIAFKKTRKRYRKKKRKRSP
jgi:hypothetical protein